VTKLFEKLYMDRNYGNFMQKYSPENNNQLLINGYVSYFNHLFDPNYKYVGKNLNGCHWGLGVTDELFNTFIYTLKI
jgi:hypothetical protein